MKREPVESSNVKSVGFDPETKTLEVEFSSGVVYQYEGVSPETHQELMEADSIGSFFHKNIRGQFKAIKRTETVER